MFRKLTKIIISLSLLVGMVFGLSTPALADCQDTGDVGDGSGGDIVTCDNNPGADADGYTGTSGNDQITVEAGATVGDSSGDDHVRGDAGNDTIENNGTVEDNILGDDGNDDITNNSNAKNLYGGNENDTINNSGTVENIFGQDDDDVITNSGTVDNQISGGSGDDTVILSGADVKVGGNITGSNGGETNGDTLNFNMSTSDQDEFDTANTAINTAIGNGHADGNFAWNGGTITWKNFETLLNNLIGTGVRGVNISDGDAGGDTTTTDDGDDTGSTVTTVYSDSNVSVNQDGDSGTLYFFGENGDSDHLIASVSQSDYANAGAGQVLVTVVDDDLGVLLYVEALGDGQLVVQYYSTADGSLLSNTVISV